MIVFAVYNCHEHGLRSETRENLGNFVPSQLGKSKGPVQVKLKIVFVKNQGP